MASQQEKPFPKTPVKASSNPSPPLLDTAECAETKQSRKREREVSLEPGTPSGTEIDAIPRDRKDSRVPAKKNRRALATTVEEDDDNGATRSRSNSGTPPLSASPPQEMKIKVRQISQGVEDLSWRNMANPLDQKDEVMAEEEALEHAVEVQRTQGDEAQAQSAITPDEESTQPDKQDIILAEAPIDNDTSSAEDVDTDVLEAAPDVIPAQPVARKVSSAAVASPPISPSRERGFSESGEKGVKRKFLERGTSQGPSTASTAEALKRPREEADRDANPRETKRPTPPPEAKRTSPPSPKIPKLGGFMAYASASSPFANVKGKNLFASSKASSSTSSLASSTSVPKLGESSTSLASSSSGFGAFAGVSSPFATVAKSSTALGASKGFASFSSAASPFASVTRAKSPPAKNHARDNSLTAANNPFASYATADSGFGTAKRAKAASPGGSSRNSLERQPAAAPEESGDDESDDKQTTFGERLRASGKDEDDENEEEEDEQRVALTAQDLVTGEEEEETLMQMRGKLFRLDGGQWKERGTGILKINVNATDGSAPRLVMRKDAVHTLLLNQPLFRGMRCTLAQDPRYLRFSVIEDGKAAHYNLRVANAKIAQDFLDELEANIPAN